MCVMLILLYFALAVFLNLLVDLFGGIAHYLCSVSIAHYFTIIIFCGILN